MDPLDVPIHHSGRLDRSLEVFIVQTAFVVLSGLCLLTRAYIKCFIIRKNLLDDYLLYGAMLGYVVYSTIVIDGSHNRGAIGKHPSLNPTIDEAARSLRAWYLTMVMYPPITFAIRASVAVLLLRLTVEMRYIWIIRITIITNAVVSTVLFFVLMFQCSPPQYFWRQLYGDSGKCYNRLITTHSVTVYSVFSAVCDWCLGLLPIAILWSVQINFRTKAVIASLLSLGMIAGIVLIIRISYMTRLQPGLRFLYEATDVAIWSVMEAALGIIAACVATFRPLFKSCGFGWNSRRRGYSDPYRFPERQIPDPFPPTADTRRSGLRHPFDVINDESNHGSEHELTAHKAV